MLRFYQISEKINFKNNDNTTSFKKNSFVFLSRVTESKGVYNLISVIKKISLRKKVTLDIYGPLDKNEDNFFSQIRSTDCIKLLVKVMQIHLMLKIF